MLKSLAVFGLVALFGAGSAMAASTSGDLYGGSSGSRVLKLYNHRTNGHDGDIIHIYARNVDTGELTPDLLVGHVSNDDFRTIDFGSYDTGCRFNVEADFRDDHVQKLIGYNFCHGPVTWHTHD